MAGKIFDIDKRNKNMTTRSIRQLNRIYVRYELRTMFSIRESRAKHAKMSGKLNIKVKDE